jgi:hypothetical protein
VKVAQQFVMIMIAATAIVMWISTIAMGMIPQAAYAQQNEVNPPLSSSSSVDSCASDQLPASIDGKIRCMGQGECYSEQFEFEGKDLTL